ncbi:MAG: hypothetical protein HUU11_07385 [Anaerolineales bacterium]|nr:hypothetical protein [Anaerolineales bacterium]
MNAEIFAEWLRRQGHTVIKTQSSYWADFGPRVLQAFPYHWVISPDEEEIEKLISDQRAAALRYSTPPTSLIGALSYHVVLDRDRYSSNDLPKKARHDVKKGLSVSSIEQIPIRRLATEGWELRRDTLARQARPRAETEQDWQRLCASAEGLSGFEAWGALVQGKLAASLLAFLCDDYYCILYHQSLTKYLPLGVNNALTYAVTASVISRLGNRTKILYGLHSLDAPPSVDEFKFRMGYTAKPVRQMVVFHPWLRPFMNRVSHALLKAGLRLRRGDTTLSKAEGMLRFYLQGRLPLEKQPLPPPLQSR